MSSSLFCVHQTSKYNLYLLVIVTLVYILNQVDRYLLPITTTTMGQDLGYGERICIPNSSHFNDDVFIQVCRLNGTSQNSCLSIQIEGNQACAWHYNGLGMQYALLVGPAFILVYTVMGLLVGHAGEVYNRKNLLGICLIAWSLVTVGMGFTENYWQLIILRIGLGFWEAGCTPFVTMLLVDSFPVELRTASVAIYNWGLHLGYSLSYAIGDFIPQQNILYMGWTWAYFLAGISGIALGFIVFLTLRDPRFKSSSIEERKPKKQLWNIHQVRRVFLRPSMIILCFAGSIRNAAIYVWVFYTHPYFELIGQDSRKIGMYMSWIPVVGGVAGAVAASILIEYYLFRKSPFVKILILSCTQIVASPFAAGALFLHPPFAYLSQIAACFFGDIWINLAIAVVVDLSPSTVSWVAISLYFFIITNLGGNAPVLVPIIEKAFRKLGFDYVHSLKCTLYILYPGFYLLSSLLFLLSLIFLWRDTNYIKEMEYKPMPFIRPVIIISSEDTSSNASSEKLDDGNPDVH